MNETSHATPAPAIAALDQLALQRSRGRWILPTALCIAALWWIAGGAGLIAWLGWATVAEAKPLALIAGGSALLVPGFLLIMAALIARQTHQTAVANDHILAAAARLMTPLESSAEEARVFADQVSQACSTIERAMGQSLAALKAMSAELGDERHRLESVTYASADNARDLADRLGAERARLELLARELQAQTTALQDTIPQQANQMLGAVRAAAEDIGRAETVLEGRLNAVNTSGQALADRVNDLDTLSQEAMKRNETLLFAVAQIDEKLAQSGKIIEAASQSSERAVSAAGMMGDRLVEAVKTALDTARQASAEIQQRTLEASEAAASSLAQLKSAGEKTSAILQTVRESKPIAPTHGIERMIADEPSPPDSGLDETAFGLEDSVFDPSPPDAEQAEPASEPAPSPRAIQPPPSRTVEEDLFERTADQLAANFGHDADPFSDPETTSPLIGEDTTISIDLDLEDTDDVHRGNGIIDADYTEPAEQPAPANSLSDIIADMERQERDPLSREETAKELVGRLIDSGIRLPDIFRPREKKKAALASRKGDKPRRSAINQSVGRQVDRVRKRLRNDGDLMMLARDFVAHEQSDALNALENTHSTQKNASARLAAFLLVDAALT